MEWLGLFLLGWFGKKLKAFGLGLLKFTWFLIRAKPMVRCYVAMVFHTAFMNIVGTLLEAGVLRGNMLRKAGQFNDWLYRRLKAWQKRVGPPENAA